jgi:hypothetical protein
MEKLLIAHPWHHRSGSNEERGGETAVTHHHKRVGFFSTVELENALEQEKAQGRSGQVAGRLAHSDLVILDDLGYLPFSASGGGMLFHLLSKLYERTSVIRRCQDDNRIDRQKPAAVHTAKQARET